MKTQRSYIVFILFSFETVFKSYRFESCSYRCKVKKPKKVCGFDEKGMKTYSCRRGLRYNEWSTLNGEGRTQKYDVYIFPWSPRKYGDMFFICVQIPKFTYVKFEKKLAFICRTVDLNMNKTSHF